MEPNDHQLSRANCRPRNGMVFIAHNEEYHLGGKIGDGAVGLVRKATRRSSGGLFAVKFLAPDPKYIDETSFDDVAARFRREGMRGPNLAHPNLVRILAYCENDQGAAFRGAGPCNPFIVMECVRGRSLESYIKKLRPEEKGRFVITREKLIIGIQIVRALEYLHKKKLVHRDVKPANVFLTRGGDTSAELHAELGDFGVVKWGDFHSSVATGTLTVTSQQGLGTLKYMAPEQALAPKRVTVRADIYSLGITLFELFTGSILASAHHVFGIMSARLSRGNTISRFFELGYKLDFGDADLGELILDMHLRGPDGRPSIQKVRGHLEWQLGNRFEESLPDEW